MKETKFIAWPDTHLPFHDKKAVETALKIVKWYQPQETIILGDFADCAPVSHWNRKNLEARKTLNMASDFRLCNRILDEIQKDSKRLIYLEGNHENWLEQAMQETPELRGLLDLDVNLGFEEREVEFLRYNQLYTLGKLNFTHGIYTCQHHAKKHVESFGCSIVYGHLHDVQLHVKVSPVDVEDKHLGLSLGCLAGKNPEFMRNRPNNWCHCIGVGCVRSDGTFNIDPVIISQGVATYAGKTFKS